MIFRIERTSEPNERKQPCKGAYSLAPEPKACRAKEIGHMACDCGHPDCHGAPVKREPPVWLIEINSLEQLLELIQSDGKLVIDSWRRMGVGTEYGIEIYDTYRE